MRVQLKEYDVKDLDRLKYLVTNEEIKKTFMIPDFQSEEDLLKMVNKLMEWSRSKEHYVRGIYLENQLIGFVVDVENEDFTIEVGYVVDPAFGNQGYATESLQIAIKELFQMGYTQVLAGAFDENPGSFRVMEKCGMKKIAKKDSIMYQGREHHCSYYSITK